MKKRTQHYKMIRIGFISSLLIMFTLSVKAQTPKDLEAHKRKWDTPAWTDGIKNPLAGNPAWTDSGKVLYAKVCAVCHGAGGKGDGVAAAGLTIKPANHTSPNVQLQTDGSLFYEMSNGHSPMPAYKDVLTENQRWGLVNFIRALGKNTKPVRSANK
jgi:mono/diheme cytochrome c family protein